MRQIYLIGIGMGNPDTLTVGAQKIIARSDCLIGAKRMLQTVNHPTARQFSSFRNEEIAEYIAQQPKSCTISVLLSGDTGFYSGAKKLAGLLKSRFPDDCKSFRKQIIQCFSLLQTFFKNTGPAAKFFIGKLRHHRFKSFNFVHNRINPFQFSLAVSSQNF